MPPSAKLQYLQFFNANFHFVFQTDFNNPEPDDMESDLVNCLITLKDWVRNDDEIITYLSYIVSMVNCLEEQQIPVPVAGVPQKKFELLSLSGILEGYTYNQIQIPPHSWCESQIGDNVSSSDVSMESVQDEETHSEQMPEVDDIGEDIEADQNKQFHCDQCNRYFMLKEHLDTHENEAHCMGKEEETGSRPSSPLQPNDIQK